MTLASSSGYLTRLYKLLTAHFDLDELRTLCFDLSVDYDTLRGDEKSTKALELISLMLREHRLNELVSTLRKERPSADWPTEAEQPSPDELLAWATPGTLNAADYLIALRDYCANLPYLTLHDIRPPKTLDEVYVPLKARPQPRKDEKPERDEERARRELERSGPLSIADVMRQHDPPHVLILGEPGAGKSTLLRQLAEHAWGAPDKIGLDAPHLPILVPLRRLAAAEGALEERLNHALTAELTLTQALPQGFFTNWPRQTGANWLILLDALDEVPAEQRAQTMQWLKGLLGRIGQHRVVLTSRPSGYKQGELDDNLFSHYDLLSFTPDQTGEFARKWFEDGQGTGTAEQFLKELERIRAGALSGTPLLLTIAAKVYLEKGTLPERRSGLYGQFVDIWLAEAEQRGLRAELGDAVCDVAKFVLARLALAITEKPTQTEASLSKVAADYLRDAVPLTPERAGITGEKFLRVMARRSGVFTHRGDAYHFIHSTFREYLAAYVVVQESEQTSAYDLELIWRRAVSHWADENWREVALFALGILSDREQDVTALVSRVWRGRDRVSNSQFTFLVDSPYEHNIERLYFAGAALVEQVKVNKNFSDGIINDMFIEAHPLKWGRWRAISMLGELRSYPRASDLLLKVDDYTTSFRMRRKEFSKSIGVVAKRLGQSNNLSKLARYEIRKELTGIRVLFAMALGQLGQDKAAASILLSLACDERMLPLEREKAARALGDLGRTDDAVQAWLALAHDENVGAQLREYAIAATEEFANSRILPELERIAEKDKSQNVRHAAQWVIAQIRERTGHNHADTQTTPSRQD